MSDAHMTVQDVLAAVHDIFVKRDDDELAHSMEDELHQEILKAIAAGAPNAAELAKAALETANIEFSRRCA